MVQPWSLRFGAKSVHYSDLSCSISRFSKTHLKTPLGKATHWLTEQPSPETGSSLGCWGWSGTGQALLTSVRLSPLLPARSQGSCGQDASAAVDATVCCGQPWERDRFLLETGRGTGRSPGSGLAGPHSQGMAWTASLLQAESPVLDPSDHRV